MKIDFLDAFASECVASNVFCDVLVVPIKLPLPSKVDITTVAWKVVPPLSMYIFSSTFAPILKPCAMCDGGTVSEVCPNRNNLSLLDVAEVSIWRYSICWSLVTTERGVITDVINPLSSFAKASFLNPSAARENVPKLEFEFVIEASAPLIILKWLWKPIANTETICTTASFDTLIWLVLHPFL